MEEILVVEKRNGKLGAEEQLMVEMATDDGLEIRYTYEKTVARGHFKFEPNMIVAGSVPFIKHALRAYGKELPPEDSYPECLSHTLHRTVKKMNNLWDAKLLLDKGEKWFIKPQVIKRFTGFVADQRNDFRFNGASAQTPVWISEPVKFVSEWRFYVVNGLVISSQFADNGGDRTIPIDHHVVNQAIHMYYHVSKNEGFAIDFGVLSTGETALVEVNDGFSIGAYGNIAYWEYWDLVTARWRQLIS